MDNERSQWHSDDELASALERALEITQTGAIPIVSASGAGTSDESIRDLFAALVDETPDPASHVGADVSPSELVPTEPSSATAAPEPSAFAPEPSENSVRESVYESLDDFKPRTNFIPVVSSSAEVDDEVSPPTSAAVTMPVQWTPSRPSFDEVVFGSDAVSA